MTWLAKMMIENPDKAVELFGLGTLLVGLLLFMTYVLFGYYLTGDEGKKS